MGRSPGYYNVAKQQEFPCQLTASVNRSLDLKVLIYRAGEVKDFYRRNQSIRRRKNR
jgi:hypothetical protein